MKRYYLAKIKTITEGGSPLNIHRFQQFANVDYAGGTIATNEHGVPRQAAILLIVGGINHALWAADDEVAQIPVVDIFMKVGSTHTPTRLGFKAKAKSLGLDAADVDAVMSNADGWIDVINHFGRLNVLDFNAQSFDLDES